MLGCKGFVLGSGKDAVGEIGRQAAVQPQADVGFIEDIATPVVPAEQGVLGVGGETDPTTLQEGVVGTN